MTTHVRVDDSHLFCPRHECGKRLHVEIGQDDDGVTRMWHVCYSCDPPYVELDREWKAPRVRTRVTPAGAKRAADRLREMRMR